jgi:MFS family permease
MKKSSHSLSSSSSRTPSPPPVDDDEEDGGAEHGPRALPEWTSGLTRPTLEKSSSSSSINNPFSGASAHPAPTPPHPGSWPGSGDADGAGGPGGGLQGLNYGPGGQGMGGQGRRVGMAGGELVVDENGGPGQGRVWLAILKVLVVVRPFLGERNAVAAVPFFFGYVILFVSIVLIVAGAPGLTGVIGQLIDKIGDLDHGWTETEFALVNMTATIGTGALLPLVGAAIDRLGPRLVGSASVLAFGLACVLWATTTPASVLSLLLCIFALRSLGAGALPLVAGVVTNLWWVRKRGVAQGIIGAITSIVALGLTPSISKVSIDKLGFHKTMANFAIITMVVVLPLVWLSLRRAPEFYDLLPDGDGFTANALTGVEVEKDEEVSLQVESANLSGATARGQEVELGAAATSPGSTRRRVTVQLGDLEGGREPGPQDLSAAATANNANNLSAASRKSARSARSTKSAKSAKSAKAGKAGGAAKRGSAVGGLGTALGGLVTDVRVAKGKRHRVTLDGLVEEVHWTVFEATGTPAFWVFAAAGFCNAALTEAMLFTLPDYLEERGKDTGLAITSIYLGLAVLAAVSSFITGMLLRSIAPQRLLAVALLFLSLSGLLMGLWQGGGLVPAFAGFFAGASIGLTRGVTSVAFALFFGREHYGAIIGIVSGIVIIGGALGPVPFSLIKDGARTYKTAFLSFFALPLLLALVVPFVAVPRVKDPERKKMFSRLAFLDEDERAKAARIKEEQRQLQSHLEGRSQLQQGQGQGQGQGQVEVVVVNDAPADSNDPVPAAALRMGIDALASRVDISQGLIEFTVRPLRESLALPPRHHYALDDSGQGVSANNQTFAPDASALSASALLYGGLHNDSIGFDDSVYYEQQDRVADDHAYDPTKEPQGDEQQAAQDQENNNHNTSRRLGLLDMETLDRDASVLSNEMVQPEFDMCDTTATQEESE